MKGLAPQIPLEPSSVQALTPIASPYKATDGKGQYLLIQPNGARYWRFRYCWTGKQNTLSCGIYPEVTLDEARAKRDGFRFLLSQGGNPSECVKAARAAELDEQARKKLTTRFVLDSDGALDCRIGNRSISLTPSETAELRSFLDATRAVAAKVKPCR